MAEIETDLEKAQVTAAGLQRYFRRRLRNLLIRDFVGLVVCGGIFTEVTPRPHMAVVAIVCVSVATLIAVVLLLRYAQLVRALRRDPEQAVARITKWRRVNAAGFRPVSQR